MYKKLSYKPHKECPAKNRNNETNDDSLEKDLTGEIILKDINVKDDIINISEKDSKIIKETYEIYKKNGVDNTLKVFIRMFIEHPEYKVIWPQFREIPDSSFILSSALRKHAEVYVAGLSIIIDNIEDKEKMKILIKKIALAHVKWTIKKCHVDNMLPEILYVLKEIVPNYNKEVECAWTILYNIIGDLLEEFKKDHKKNKNYFGNTSFSNEK
uniref:GLOBIN domain-containing protein n=1 Tax=Parastrongyloides trichosuri TaxID=131310 RepID=A0A0N4ZHE5_PARTI